MSISASLTAIWLVATSQLFDVASSSFLSKRAQPSVSIVVDTSIKYQELDGFGCSQAFQRAEDIFGKYGLDAENTQYVLDL